jgi:hypothetical protein
MVLGYPKSLTLKMEAVSSSKNSVHYFQVTRRCFSEYCKSECFNIMYRTTYEERMEGVTYVTSGSVCFSGSRL